MCSKGYYVYISAASNQKIIGCHHLHLWCIGSVASEQDSGMGGLGLS